MKMPAETADSLPAEPQNRALGQDLAAVGFLIAKGLACALPKNMRYGLARWIGRATGHLLTEKRRAVQTNLKILLGNDVSGLEQKTDEIFENFALTLCDFVNPRNVTYELTGLENLGSTASTQEGVLFITFHLGHWDLGARILCDKGWKLTAIYQSYSSAFLQKVIQANRPEKLHYLPVGQGAAFGAMSALVKGEGVAVIGDKAFGEPGEPTSFLGGTVLWPKGPYLLASRSAAWVVPGVVVRVSPGHYKGLLDKPIRVSKESTTQAADLSNHVAERLAHYLRTYPTQWYRFEKFWMD
jgi:lauroyl/myristoyl acyltransferase